LIACGGHSHPFAFLSSSGTTLTQGFGFGRKKWWSATTGIYAKTRMGIAAAPNMLDGIGGLGIVQFLGI
jgi:hypothetical protein